MEFICLKSFKDNYIHLLLNTKNNSIVIVDPGEFSPVIDFIETRQNPPVVAGILITHHHSDHIDGVLGLKSIYNCPVYAPLKEKDSIPFADIYVKESERFKLDLFEFTVWEIPGHTLGHVGYLETNLNWFFCGDTLFSLGCGRLFEGTPEMMFKSLSRIKTLPDNTLIFCSHEYTLKNLNFSIETEASINYSFLKNWTEKRHQQGLPTVPTTIERERTYNLFLRSENVATFTELRKKRDIYE